MSNNSEKLFKGLSIQAIVTIVMGGLEVFVFAIMSRLLTKTEFGYMATIMAIVSIFYSISEAGIGSSIIQKKDDSSKHISTAFSLSIILGGIFSFILFLISPIIARLIADTSITTPLRIISVMLLLNSMQSVGNSILTRAFNFKKMGILNVCSYVISSTVGILMAYCGLGVYSIICYQILYALLKIIFIYSLGVKMPSFALYSKEVKEVLSFGGWLSLSVVFNNLNTQIDKFVMPRLLSIEALGTYNRPTGFIGTITSKLNSIFDTVLFPLLSKIQDDKEKMASIYLKSISLLNTFSIPLAAIFFFNANLIITIFFGSQWIDLVPVTRIIAISVIFLVDGRLVDCFFRSLGLVKLQFFLRVIGVFITTICIVVGAHYDVIGVAAGYVISLISIIIAKIYILNNKMECSLGLLIRVWIRSWAIIIPLIIISLIFYLFFDNGLISCILFSFVFVSVLFSELLFFPHFIGREYYKTIYPKLSVIINKSKN